MPTVSALTRHHILFVWSIDWFVRIWAFLFFVFPFHIQIIIILAKFVSPFLV
jgi:hypothetical protein